jgi:tRNA-specific 2-thiouridylase
MQDEPGDVLDAEGNVRGRHPGHRNFTVGQRKGLGVSAPEPLYVLATDAAANTITVGVKDQLRTHAVNVRDLVLHRPPEEVDRVKLRYRSAPLACRLRDDRIELDEPVSGAAPGQVAVLLRGDAVAGHGIITR